MKTALNSLSNSHSCGSANKRGRTFRIITKTAPESDFLDCATERFDNRSVAQQNIRKLLGLHQRCSVAGQYLTSPFRIHRSTQILRLFRSRRLQVSWKIPWTRKDFSYASQWLVRRRSPAVAAAEAALAHASGLPTSAASRHRAIVRNWKRRWK